MNQFPMLIPDGWPVQLADCRPGPILVCPVDAADDPQLCFKSEYKTDAGKIEAYNSAGEFLCIEPSHMVQPVTLQWSV